MLKIKQKNLKKILTILKPGATKTTGSQAGCITFRKDTVTAESPFFSVSCPLKSDIEGSYDLANLLKIVGQIKVSTEVEIKKTEKTLSLTVTEGEKKLQFAVKAQWEAPTSSLPVPNDKEWDDIPNGFTNGLADTFPIAKKSSSPSDHSHCVYITPTHFAATDGSRVVLRLVKNHLSSTVILPANSIKELLKINPTQYAQIGPHVFFRNTEGVVYSLSAFLDQFPEIAHLFKVKLGPEIITSNAFKEIVQTANSMEAQRIDLHFKGSKVTLLSVTQNGPIKGVCPVDYKGPDFNVKLRPGYLLDGLQYTNIIRFSSDLGFLAVYNVNTRYLAGVLLG